MTWHRAARGERTAASCQIIWFKRCAVSPQRPAANGYSIDASVPHPYSRGVPNRPSPSTATPPPPLDSSLIWSSVSTPTPPSGDSVSDDSVRSLIQAGHTAVQSGNWTDALEALNAAYDRLATHDFSTFGPNAPEAADAAELFIVMGLTRYFRDELDLAEEAFDTAYAV